MDEENYEQLNLKAKLKAFKNLLKIKDPLSSSDYTLKEETDQE